MRPIDPAFIEDLLEAVAQLQAHAAATDAILIELMRTAPESSRAALKQTAEQLRSSRPAIAEKIYALVGP